MGSSVFVRTHNVLLRWTILLIFCELVVRFCAYQQGVGGFVACMEPCFIRGELCLSTILHGGKYFVILSMCRPAASIMLQPIACRLSKLLLIMNYEL